MSRDARITTPLSIAIVGAYGCTPLLQDMVNWIPARAGMVMHLQHALEHENPVARIERSGIRESYSAHSVSWIALRFIQATFCLCSPAKLWSAPALTALWLSGAGGQPLGIWRVVSPSQSGSDTPALKKATTQRVLDVF